jgi:hypothetical protein
MRYQLLLLSACAISGCNTEELVFSDRESVSAIRWNSKQFEFLEFGEPGEPISDRLTIGLRIPGEEDIEFTSELNEHLKNLIDDGETLDASQWTSFGAHPSRHPSKTKATWGEGALRVKVLRDFKSNRSITTIVRDRTLLGLRVSGFPAEGEEPIQIRVGDSKWCRFPLSRERLRDLFGPEEAAFSYGQQ